MTDPPTDPSTASCAVADRRKARRRQWQDPTVVMLHTVGENEHWQCEAMLLNLSPDGMACRVRNPDASGLETGRTFLVMFRLGESSPFEFLGRVTNVTEGGSTGHSVVGFEFAKGLHPVPNRRRLQDALEKERPNHE